MSKEWYLVDNDMYDGVIQDNMQNFYDILNSSISEEVVIDNAKCRAIINGNDYRNKTSENTRRIMMEKGIEYTGAIVLYRENKWLITSRPEWTGIYDKAIIEWCNNVLTFQLEDDTIYSTPCIFQTPSMIAYTKETNDIITTSSEVMYVRCQINEFTNTLDVNRRVIFNNDKRSVYKIGNIQTITKQGIMTITLERDTYNAEKDNLELNIAGYVKTNKPTPSENYKITIKGDENPKRGNRKYTYRVVVTKNDIEVSDKIVKWELTDIDKVILNESYSGNECTLTTHKQNTGEFFLKAVLEDDETLFCELNGYVCW